MTPPRSTVVTIALILVVTSPLLAQDVAPIGSSAAVEALARAARTGDDRARTKAIHELARVAKPETATPILVKLLDDSDWVISGEAYVALGRVGPRGLKARAAWLRAALAPTRSVALRCRAALAATAAEQDSPAIRAAIRPAFAKQVRYGLRLQTLVTLRYLGPKAAWATPDLLDDLKRRDPDPGMDFGDVRITIGAVGVGSAYEGEVLAKLTRCLRDPRFGVRAATVDGLSHFDLKKHPKLLAAIGALANDPHGWVRWRVRKALKPYLPRPAPLDSKAPLASLRVALRSDDMKTCRRALLQVQELGSKAAAALPDLLAVDRIDHSEEIWESLAAIGRPALPALIMILGSADKDERCRAAGALATLPGSLIAPAAPALVRAAKQGPERFTGQAALKALKQIASRRRPELIPVFVEGLRTADAQVTLEICFTALNRFGAAGHRAQNAWFAKILSPKRKHECFQALELAVKFGRGHWRHVRDRLADLLRTSEDGLLNWTASTLAQQGPRSVWALPLLLDRLERDEQDSAKLWTAAGRIGVGSSREAQLVKALTPALGHAEPKVRAVAAYWAARCNLARHPQARAALVDLRHDPDPTTRRVVRDTLTQRAQRLAVVTHLRSDLRSGDRKRIRGALLQVRSLGRSARPLVQDLARHTARLDVNAIHGLGYLGAPAVPLLRKLLKSGQASRRAAAATVLQGLGLAGEPALPELIAAAERDVDPRARQTALSALAEVTTQPELVIPVLARRLQAKDRDVVWQAHFALRKFPLEPAAVLALEAWYRSSLASLTPARRGQVACFALQAGKDTPQIRRWVLAELRQPDWDRRHGALVAIRDEVWGIPHLIRALRDDDKGMVRRTAYWGLRRFGTSTPPDGVGVAIATYAAAREVAEATRKTAAACVKAAKAHGADQTRGSTPNSPHRPRR